MWVHRVGPQNAKRMLFTGDLITGKEANDMGLVAFTKSKEEIDKFVDSLATRISSVPKNQLAMNKLMINQAIDAQGLPQTQMFSSFFDGYVCLNLMKKLVTSLGWLDILQKECTLKGVLKKWAFRRPLKNAIVENQ